MVRHRSAGGRRVLTPPEYTDAVSLEIRCDTQKELDHYWNRLLAGGGREVQCGWLIDRYGVRWQVTPHMLYDLARGDGDRYRSLMGPLVTGAPTVTAALTSRLRSVPGTGVM